MITFYKYQGTGNDFIMIDDRASVFPSENNTLVAKLCDRKFGIGADGLILLQKSNTADFFMKYYNSDGNESSMCGNGGRCIAAFANQLKIVGNKTIFHAVDGNHDAHITEQGNAYNVKLKMQDVPSIEVRDQHSIVLNTGSPHFVVLKNENIDSLNIVEEARKIRYNEEFKKSGINVNFINIGHKNELHIRTYERGVEDETLSCGTGVTAAALSSAIINNLESGNHTIAVNTKGGNLSVTFNYNKNTCAFTDIWLIGEAVKVFEGQINI